MDLSKKKYKRIIGLALICGLILWTVLNYNVALGILGWILTLLMPLIIGFAIAFILNVLVRAIENHLWRPLDKRFTKVWPKLRRAFSMIISILVLIGIIKLVITLLVPQIRATWEMLIALLPGFWEQVQIWLNNIAAEYNLDEMVLPEFEWDYDSMFEFTRNYLFTGIASVTNGVSTAFGTAFVFMTSFIGKIINLVLGIVFALYMLATKETLKTQATKLVKAFMPQHAAEETLFIGRTANRIYSSFVVGQCIEACIIGALCAIGMMIFKFPYVPMISVLIGFTALIPVFGAFIGTGIGAFLILIDNPMQALWFIIFIIVIQQIDAKLIYPRVVGNQVGLPPMWTLLGVILGGSVGGLIGMLLGVPTLALIYTLVGRKADRKLAEKCEANESDDSKEITGDVACTDDAAVDDMLQQQE